MKNEMKCNVYVGDFRAVAIAGHWRITKRNPKRNNEWLFLDDIEYATASEALEKYI
jgi:hypothetical protein